jgi:hypothetical protein
VSGSVFRDIRMDGALVRGGGATEAPDRYGSAQRAREPRVDLASSVPVGS